MGIPETSGESDKDVKSATRVKRERKRGKLTVAYTAMRESNGRHNWTAILHAGDASEGITIARSEYPERVRYDADRMRYLIGELDEPPEILDYNGDLKSKCHLCNGVGTVNGKMCPGLNFRGTVHNSDEEMFKQQATVSRILNDAVREKLMAQIQQALQGEVISYEKFWRDLVDTAAGSFRSL